VERLRWVTGAAGRKGRMDVTIGTIVIDCNDPQRLADFWCAAMGRRASHDEGSPYTSLKDTRGREPELVLQKVPEPKSCKNRVHFDLYAPDADAEAARLVAVGATLQTTHREQGDRWFVMQDPEGNEFCVIPSDREKT
jgi:predicted enzyme related to lactoylglutathione lyase